jgi:hypothetical protein
MKVPAWIIKHRFSYGWDVNEDFYIYSTKAEAKEALDDLIESTEESFKSGDMSEAYCPNDFRIELLLF